MPVSFAKTRFFEVKPGIDAARYLGTYGFLTGLAKRAAKRDTRFFVEFSSNIDRHVLSEGLFEKGVIELLEYVIRQLDCRDLMIDIGANIGNHTVALAPLFKQVEAVEPHPVLTRVLEANVLRNGLGHVTCHRFGLAGEDVEATLTESVSNHGLSRVKERSQLSPEVFGLSTEEFGSEYAVQLRSAHEFVSQFSEHLSRAFIKIDVEGMEQEIIEAISPLLVEHRPLVGFEWFAKAQPRLTEVVTSLPGYELWGIRMHDTGKNLPWRAVKMLFSGRTYTLEKIDPANLDDVYPLALLIPAKG